MYRIAPDPQENCQRRNLECQHMDYAEGSFALDLVELILESNMEIIDKSSNPKVYEKISQQFSWLNQPTDLVQIGDEQTDKISLSRGLSNFLVTNYVKGIALPPKK